MVANQSLWGYVVNAGPVVKMVMLLLITASVMSWTFILQRSMFLKRVKMRVRNFEDRFWNGGDISKLFNDLDRMRKEFIGLEGIFHAGYKEFTRLRDSKDRAGMMDRVQRAMRIAYSRELENLENNLPFLASVGSTSPYIGLFGTVWGIMTSFHALGNVQQASVSTVAPGISEALIATAMGLFAAIPAVLAYNRYSSQVERLMNNYETFQEEFSNILYRQIQGDG